jgi:tyrosyl-tRNA synthetase
MSKSYGNYVGITETPNEMFGKLMSISDELMWKYFELLTDESLVAVESRRRAVSEGSLHPKQAKVALATMIVRDFHGEAGAAAAAEEFERRFARKELPSDIRVVRVAQVPDESKRLTAMMVEAGLASSASDAGRKIQQGGVRLEGQRVTDPQTRLRLVRDSAGAAVVTIQVGRQAVRVERDNADEVGCRWEW